MKLTREERRALMRDLREHGGNTKALAATTGAMVTAVRYRVAAAGLDAYAARLRAKAGVSGGRKSIPPDPAGDERRRAKFRAALREHATQGRAAEAVGMHRRRFQRELERLGIK